MKCVVCGKKVDKDLVMEMFEHLFIQADCCGVESLTEHEQVVYEWKCCPTDCYYKLD